MSRDKQTVGAMIRGESSTRKEHSKVQSKGWCSGQVVCSLQDYTLRWSQIDSKQVVYDRDGNSTTYSGVVAVTKAGAGLLFVSKWMLMPPAIFHLLDEDAKYILWVSSNRSYTHIILRITTTTTEY
ncbi:hypothetical protein ASPBRDRAFT_285489 [Aspergillus brasiliensis CBS 101740]|uniref:Uncharacterized protein n=1 Tax=Aspergillus brasiliensis (strain CBS 101740 / IMI 381727 / IBT 21946) TaxID=767769 RepID=A0A1L9UDG7_ASPBC|nr:hypothetical protein ASPBRDRAFT_285489 [Aspergillus brasiliensis CBS 101740]